MKYKEHIINYAIDNKVSLEEAYKHFIIKGRDEKEEKFKKAYMDEETKDHFEDENYTEEPEPLFHKPGSTLSPEEEEAWKMYDAIKNDLERLYEQYSLSPGDLTDLTEKITEEDMAWVEYQLRMIDKIKDSNE